MVKKLWDMVSSSEKANELDVEGNLPRPFRPLPPDAPARERRHLHWLARLLLAAVLGGGLFPFGGQSADLPMDQPLAAVSQGGKWGFIDKQGRMVIPPQFEHAQYFSEGLAAAKQGGKWGFIDKQGRMVIPPQFEEVKLFSEGLAAVKQAGKWGFIGKQGKMVIPAQFEYTFLFRNGLAWVKQGGKFGFIDKQGEMVIPAQFEEAREFESGNFRWK